MSNKLLDQEIINHYLINSDNAEPKPLFEIFNNSNSLKIEIGCGNGHFIVDIAMKQKNVNFIAIELRFDRVCKTISKLFKRNIENVRVYFGDAKEFFKKIIPDECIDEIYYNFPDPWPKRRHHKKRLFTKEFLDLLAKKMKKKAIFTCATDHEEYLKWMLYYLDQDNRFSYVFENKIVNKIEGYYSTWFELLWRKMGKEIYYFQFIRN